MTQELTRVFPNADRKYPGALFKRSATEDSPMHNRLGNSGRT